MAVDPESEEMNTSFEGGAASLRFNSFCAIIIGPIVLVWRCRAKSSNDLLHR